MDFLKFIIINKLELLELKNYDNLMYKIMIMDKKEAGKIVYYNKKIVSFIF
jgi:hypothetical protein